MVCSFDVLGSYDLACRRAHRVANLRGVTETVAYSHLAASSTMKFVQK